MVSRVSIINKRCNWIKLVLRIDRFLLLYSEIWPDENLTGNDRNEEYPSPEITHRLGTRTSNWWIWMGAEWKLFQLKIYHHRYQFQIHSISLVRSIFYPIFLLIGFGQIFPKSPDGLVKLHVVKNYNFILAPLDEYNNYQENIGGFHTITVPPLNTLKDSPQITHYDSSPQGSGKSSNR